MKATFLDEERARVCAMISAKSEVFDGAAGGGRFARAERPFVLIDPEKNLWGPVRREALAYFSENSIAWWGGKRVTGHTLSSQVACVNHLLAWRRDEEAAAAVLKAVSPDFVRPLRIESDQGEPGFVQFESVSDCQYLREDGLTRGAQCTSVDAMMYAERADGSRCLVPIEWKYTEQYGNDNKATDAASQPSPINGKGAVRQQRYNQLIRESGQLQSVDLNVYYFEPFYQLMRQTLLVEQIVRHRDQETLRADRFLHLHVIPRGNAAGLSRTRSTAVAGSTWKQRGAGSSLISRDTGSSVPPSSSRRSASSRDIRN